HQYRSTQAPEADAICYGALRLDRTGCCAYRDGEPLALNAKEFKLLRFLMEHPEQVFTKRQLYGAVWDDPYMGDDNTIMVHISHLRNKIETDPQNPAYIKTIRGLGYKLHHTEKRP
ncbi:MAG TPA: winged helix-turn-helix domain-containing protein, partial [Clostridia bacterium]|nr:winged helix-turn-helix domain-containing protein [Clostridia bacterium]